LLEQPGLVYEHHRLDPVAQAELLQDVRDVRLYGRLVDVELAPDFRIGQAGRDQPQDLVFSLGQLAEFFRRGRANDAGELPDHALGDRGRQQRVSRGDGAHRTDELLSRVVLEHEAARAGPQGLVDVLVEAEGSQDQDAGDVVGCQDAPGRLEAVDLGHPDVHQHYRRVEPLGHGDSLTTVARFRHHLDVLLAGEQHPKARSDHRLVVGDEHADAHGRRRVSDRRARRKKPPPACGPAVISPS
jgi:hypothetical protein